MQRRNIAKVEHSNLQPSGNIDQPSMVNQIEKQDHTCLLTVKQLEYV